MNLTSIPRRWKISGVAVLTLVVLFLIIPPIVHFIVLDQIETRLQGLQKRIGYPITYRSIDFTDRTTLRIEGLTVHSLPDSSPELVWRPNASRELRAHADSLWAQSQAMPLFYLGRCTVQFYPFGAITGRWIRTVVIDTLALHLTRNQNGRYNFQNALDWWKQRKADTITVAEPEPPGDKNRIAEWVEQYLERKPPTVSIQDLAVAYEDYTPTLPKTRWVWPQPPNVFSLDRAAVTLQENVLGNAELRIKGTFTDGDQSHRVAVEGQLDNQRHEMQVEGTFDASFKVPFSRDVTNADIFLQGFDVRVMSLEQDSDVDNLKARLNITNLEVVSDAISDQKLKNMNIGFELDLDLSPDSIRIRPSTRVYLNQINMAIDGSIARLTEKPKYDFRLSLAKMSVNDFFYSIPSALMKKLTGIRVEGDMSWQAHILIDMAQLDSLTVDPDVELSDNFRVVSLGDSIFIRRLQKPFEHTVVLEDDRDCTFVVGPDNSYFTPLDSVAPILVASVMMCEDASFMKNNGFNVLQIERSLAEDIRKKRFVRGASTISMQFVKNIFLSREKTLARKFQEMVLTWLINHEKLLDPYRRKEEHKKRLLEIYLNIIEWGPDVYGVGRASEFYFKKKPSQLTISEAVFLAGIIPNPKKYERYFENGKPRKKHIDYMSVIVRILREKDFLTQEEMEANTPIQFSITGDAARLIEGYEGSDELEDDDNYKILLGGAEKN